MTIKGDGQDGQKDFNALRYGTILADSISAKGWLMTIRFILKVFKPVLAKAFETEQVSASIFGTLDGLLFNNVNTETGITRITKDGIIGMQRGIEKGTKCIKIQLLKKFKRKDACVERWLMIEVSTAKLFIAKIRFFKELQKGPDSSIEAVTKAEFIQDLAYAEGRECFEKEILPFMDSKFFSELIKVHLKPVFEYWKKTEEECLKIREIMQVPFEIANRAGIKF